MKYVNDFFDAIGEILLVTLGITLVVLSISWVTFFPSVGILYLLGVISQAENQDFDLRGYSSMVELAAHNGQIAGSIPRAPTN